LSKSRKRIGAHQVLTEVDPWDGADLCFL